ncbi:MAG: ornithine cyclodeaminase family protein, partial [Halodesulfurarchaeum sp.]
RLLSGEAVRDLVDLGDMLSVIDDAFERQRRGAVERPDRPHFPVGIDLSRSTDTPAPEAENREGGDNDPAGTALVMPAYIHGEEHYATKLVSVHDANPSRGLSTVNAQIAVNDAETGLPRAFMDGTYITAARTSCIGGLTARELAAEPVTLAIIGAGMQGRWQARAIATAVSVEEIRVWDVDPETAAEAVAELDGELDAAVRIADSATDAVRSASMIVTATTSTQPVFDGEDLRPGATVVGIGAYTPEMQELDETTVSRAARVFADVPEEVAEIGDIREAGLSVGDLHPFADLLYGGVGRETDEEVIVVESVGSAVMDAAAAQHVYQRAVEADAGLEYTI